MQRRDFIKVCAAGAAVGANDLFAARDLKPHFYARAQLADGRGEPLKAASLAARRNYLFHYPYESTPCFLLNLGRPTVRDAQLKTESGSDYRWAGGVGPDRAIVAYSAICSHRLAYPTPQITFISYRDQSTASKLMRPNAIHCCAEHSEYDPTAGGKVLGGPAPQPLCAILLEYDAAEDGLYAVGALGGELFDAFFAKYEFRLALDYGAGKARRPVGGRAPVVELERFSRQQVRC